MRLGCRPVAALTFSLLLFASRPTQAATPKSQFVTTKNGQFMVNGSTFPFIGTNACWLHALNTDDDIDSTFGNISQAGIKVVRTWAFNDVETIPVNGTWFQLIANGTTRINNGTNGLQRLDKVVEIAQKHGLYLLMSLTNNWNPRPLFNLQVTPITPNMFPRDVSMGTNNSLPRNFLSNDYGGMDVYVRQFGGRNEHDQFYVNDTLIQAFQNYITQVVSRFVNSTTVFAWEIANDPRCSSTLPASPNCKTTNITSWHSKIARHIKQVDPNHLISSGHQGFFCASCPKLFQMPNQTKNTQEDRGMGTSFDGSFGIDSEDIISIPEIGFGSFRLFPDQVQYSNLPPNPNLPAFNNTVNLGRDWIQRHIEMGKKFGKPISLVGFGLVTQSNAPFFVPSNSSIPPISSAQNSSFGVTDQQRDDAYLQWLGAGIVNGLQGIIQYQWGQTGLTAIPGTTISPTITSSGVSDNVEDSPNDGYSIEGPDVGDVIQTFQQSASRIGPDS